MEKFPSKLNMLVTSDPRYIPGYAGYCPQLKFHVGQTYGQLTSKLLTSSEGPHSSLELQNGQFPSAEREDGGRSLEMLIPGYTGFVPLRQNYFCRTYAESCKEARSEFNKKRKLRLQASAEPQPDGSNGPPDLHLKSRRLNSPLTAISYNPTPPKTPNPWKELSSPYLMEDSSPHKYFISGFTGYVPTSRFLFGCGYPVLTNKALIQFGKSRQAAQNHTPVPEETTQLPLISSTYPCHTGSLPSYTGHVPGIRFQCGQTFGKVTRDALSVLGSQRKSGRS